MTMYINTETKQYPLYPGDIKLLFPNSSFPSDFVPEAPFMPVQPTDYPQVDHTKNVTEVAPVLQDGKWVQAYSITDASAEEIEQRTTQRAWVVRTERDRKLESTDWRVVRSVESGTPVPQEWADYRQALRNVPEQAGFPWNVTWPDAP